MQNILLFEHFVIQTKYLVLIYFCIYYFVYYCMFDVFFFNYKKNLLKKILLKKYINKNLRFKEMFNDDSSLRYFEISLTLQ